MTADPDAVEIAPLTLITRRRVRGTRIQRDPAFSRKVLEAYDRACAICSISPKLGADRFGLEAAHIRWARSGGPDEVPNGLCLCRLHHEALDWGAVKVDETMKLRVSSRLERTEESEVMFGQFDGREIRLPRLAQHRPNEEMLRWHWTQVFRP
jgi:putative restriction endonuclease